MQQRVDLRTVIIMLTALALGLAWASYNLISVGPARNDEVIHALVWTVFATPLLLFMGWLLARRRERMLQLSAASVSTFSPSSSLNV
jgi:hypothetical protein